MYLHTGSKITGKQFSKLQNFKPLPCGFEAVNEINNAEVKASFPPFPALHDAQPHVNHANTCGFDAYRQPLL
jgi:hypothetical protein